MLQSFVSESWANKPACYKLFPKKLNVKKKWLLNQISFWHHLPHSQASLLVGDNSHRYLGRFDLGISWSFPSPATIIQAFPSPKDLPPSNRGAQDISFLSS
jgi:hypothetical protein